MPGPEQVNHNVEQVAKSNASEQPEETIGKGARVVEAGESNRKQMDKDKNKNLTPKQAQAESEWIVESVESKDDIQMLNEIIKAFNEDKDWKLTNLRFEYNALTNKIMASYNTEIKKVLENNNEENREGMENKESKESSSVESEEKSWDFSEFNIISINENPSLAQRLSNEVMEPQPEEVLREISDINEVLEKWSEENKKILMETISEVQESISHLYHAVWLDKTDRKENFKRAA